MASTPKNQTHDGDNENQAAKSSLIFYQSEDGKTRLEVRLENETVWLSQSQMAELFSTTIPNVNIHIRNLFLQNELQADSVIKDFLTTASDNKKYQTKHYNLDVIISVGYRVKSNSGTKFRIWATQRLREYIVKGFVLDDERLKNGGGAYFDELLSRIREIRASERNFYQKVKDIFATSVDYDPQAQVTLDFFAIAQNKIHWAIHGHTAAELISERADATKPNMGLTAWSGKKIKPEDVRVAKNYLDQNEMELLNLIVNQYLEFAEFQARTRKTMRMRDWSTKLDDFLKLNDRDVLKGLGKISSQLALEKADREYAKFREHKRKLEDAQAAQDFEKEVESLSQKTKKIKNGGK